MSLPSDGVNANALAETTTIPTGKKLIFLDPDTNEGGIITLENLTKQILSNLTSQTFNLDQGTKTLPAALNELNSKTLRISSGNEKTFKIKNNRAWLLLYALGSDGTDGEYDIYLYTPSYSGKPIVRNVTKNIPNFVTNLSILNGVVTIETSTAYIQGIALYV